MQLLLAYAFDRDQPSDLGARLDRVTSHYSPLWKVPIARRGSDLDRIGLQIWDATDSPWSWPSWQEDGDISVATVHPPFGYERVTGEVPVDCAPVLLAKALLAHPGRVGDLTAPFVIAALEKTEDRLTLITDGFGLGNLYQLRFPGGWVWSNRPAAACLFAGIRASADLVGWRAFAATGYFMGDRTPFENVYVVPPGTQVGYEARSGYFESRVDVLAGWAADRNGQPLAEERLEEVVEALKRTARSLERMRAGEILIRLSGGRDSRVVVAAFLAAGVDFRLHTDEGLPMEAQTSRQLLAAIPHSIAHHVDEGPRIPAGPVEDPTIPPTLQRALGWHRVGEGLRNAYLVAVPPPSEFRYSDFATVTGSFGELGHRIYRQIGELSEFNSLPLGRRLELFVERLVKRIVQPVAVSKQAQEAAASEIRRTLYAAAGAGIDNGKMINYFYAAERVRRWGGLDERADVVTPLLVPEFVRSCFELNEQQREENALHVALTARLVPAWADIPYYGRKREHGGVLPSWEARLAFAPDRELINALINDSSSWGEAYDAPVVQDWWRSLRTKPGARSERTLQSVIWRGVFEDFLAEVNGEEVPTRTPARSTRSLGPVRRARRLTARALNKAARVVDLPVGN
jgi:hypothetical protein